MGNINQQKTLHINFMNKIIEVAKSQIGVTESPKNSNLTKYGLWFGWNGVMWCAQFVSWCYATAGVKLPKIGFSKPGFAGCQTAVAYFKKENKITQNPVEGDIVFFDWNGDGRYDHTGLFVKDNGIGGEFTTIEGNTAIGNDSNGGQVMERTRKYGNCIFVHP